MYKVWEVKNEDNRIIHIQGPYESQTPPPEEVLGSLFPGMTHKFSDNRQPLSTLGGKVIASFRKTEEETRG